MLTIISDLEAEQIYYLTGRKPPIMPLPPPVIARLDDLRRISMRGMLVEVVRRISNPEPNPAMLDGSCAV